MASFFGSFAFVFSSLSYKSILDLEIYSRGVYYFNSNVLVSLILAFIVAVLGFQLLWEKKSVPPVLLFLSFILGAFLGLDVKPLAASELVISGSLIAAGLFVALNLEMTLVGFAVMSIIFGFFHGHAYAVDIPDSANSSLYIFSVALLIGIASFLGFLVQRYISKTSYLQLIGIVISAIGVALLLI
ncbi:MAG: hydrogenase/urease accessory protein HupE [Saprospiraceae bacterium]|jgi:hydrogenase/urease accessory protein HupE